METEFISSLIDLGSAGAVIIVVYVFINYISKRDKEMLDILGNHMSEEIKAFTNLTASVNEMRQDIKDDLRK